LIKCKLNNGNNTTEEIYLTLRGNISRISNYYARIS
jgi:hypothetical protein